MSTFAIEHKSRQAGVMGHITRTFGRRNEEQLYVFLDDSKPELSAGGKLKFTEGDQKRLNVFAGGRNVSSRSSEKVGTTFRRELAEEMESCLGLIVSPVVKNTISYVDQQLAPFIVVQKKEADAGTRTQLNEIAVTRVNSPFDDLPRELQQLLECGVEKELGFWLDMKDIVNEFLISGHIQRDSVLHKRPVRPQLLTSTYIDYLQRIAKVEQEDIQSLLNVFNGQVTRFLSKEEKKGAVVNNGFFTKKGTVLKNLPLKDKKFIGLT